MKDQPEQTAGDKSLNVDESLLVHEISRISRPEADKAGQDSDEDFDADKLIEARISKDEDASLNSSVADNELS